MKKKLLKYIVIGAIAIIGSLGYHISMNQDNIGVLSMMRNVEALAEGESGSTGVVIGHCSAADYECMTDCSYCHALYSAIPFGTKGIASNVHGTCAKCKKYFEK